MGSETCNAVRGFQRQKTPNIFLTFFSPVAQSANQSWIPWNDGKFLFAAQNPFEIYSCAAATGIPASLLA